MQEVVNKINVFLKSTTREFEARFKDGFFLKLKKHTKNKELFLEIHTSGYDDTLPIDEAIDCIKWTIYDYSANGII